MSRFSEGMGFVKEEATAIPRPQKKAPASSTTSQPQQRASTSASSGATVNTSKVTLNTASGSKVTLSTGGTSAVGMKIDAAGAKLNTTGTTLVKIWDELCIPDNPAVQALARDMDTIVKAYTRGDTRLIENWVSTAQALSDTCVKAGGKPLPSDFIAAPIVVARGFTGKGTRVDPPAVVVTAEETPADGGAPIGYEKEVAVLVDGSVTEPDGAMSTTASTMSTEQSSSWKTPLLIGGGLVVAWLVLK